MFSGLTLALLMSQTAGSQSGAYEALRTQCLLHAADPKNPWALAHGITALGPSFVAHDGRKASDVIVSDYLRKGTEGDANPYSFDRFAADGTPIEPHFNLLAKTLVKANVPPATRFKASFGQVTLAEMVEGVQRGFAHHPKNEAYWREVAWTLDLVASVLTPNKATFTNALNEKVDFNQVMDDALTYLEQSQAELTEGMKKGLPQVDKRKQGIYAHTCGGLHLFQAVAAWARHPQVRKKWGSRLTQQVDVLFYRLGSEARQYDAALLQAPQYRLQILTQMMKFYGHFLETTGRLKTEVGFKPTPAQRQTIDNAKARLDHAVRELQASKAFESMEQLRASQRQLYLDLIGDACHAANGWSYWK